MKDFSITTKKGDKGTTRLLDSTLVKKYDLRPEAYGTLDEAAAFLGLVRAKTDLDEIKQIMWISQNHIYLLNSELACPPGSLHMLTKVLGKEQLDKIEEKSKEMEKKLNLPRKFVIYGQTEISAYLDVARAIIRRTERRVVELNHIEPLKNKYIIPYINRLSDMLYLLARYDEFAHEVPYAHPSVD